MQTGQQARDDGACAPVPAPAMNVEDLVRVEPTLQLPVVPTHTRQQVDQRSLKLHVRERERERMDLIDQGQDSFVLHHVLVRDGEVEKLQLPLFAHGR